MGTVCADNHTEVHKSTDPNLPVFEDCESSSPSKVFISRMPNILHELVNNKFPLGFSKKLGFFREIDNDKESHKRKDTSCNSLEDKDFTLIHEESRSGSYSTANH